MKNVHDRVRELSLGLLLLSGLMVGCGRSSASSAGGSSAGGTAVSGASASRTSPARITLLNVSYDPTREFYQEVNQSFAAAWLGETGQVVKIDQAHGGSGKQARAVIDGLEADVVTLALAHDIDAIASKRKLLPADWQQALPHNSAPYTSTIVFLVRKGNPKNIRDWSDLVKGDVSVITANPKTGGGARWNYLAAWGASLKSQLGSWEKLNDPVARKQAEAKAKQFVTEIYRRVPVLDTAARGSTNTFVQRELGDVLLTWENEAFLALRELGHDKVEIVVPSLSILAEPPVAVVDTIARKHGTEQVAKAYLRHLYTEEGQRLAAKHFFRPIDFDALPPSQREQFANVELFSIDAVFGGWSVAQATHFDDGGVFDQIYQPGK